MNLFELLLQLERIDRLIRTKSTGCPEEFARKFDMSERNASRLIGELRDQGLPIAYDKVRHTYYYTEDVKLVICLQVAGEKLLSVQGGEKNLEKF